MAPTIIQVVTVNVQYNNSENNKFINPNESKNDFNTLLWL